MGKYASMTARLLEKIKQAIRDIFKENHNNPLTIGELITTIDQKLNNGELDNELVKKVIDIMQDRFELLVMPNGKLTENI